MCSTISDGLEADILIDARDWVAKTRLLVVVAVEKRGNDDKK